MGTDDLMDDNKIREAQEESSEASKNEAIASNDEKIVGEETRNYIHSENNILMTVPDQFGNDRQWIYEIHFIDSELEIGGFFEQLMV